MNFSFIFKYYPYYIWGSFYTLIVSLITVLLGTVIGLIVALCKISKYRMLKAIASVYIEVIRGTPMLLQVTIAHLGLSRILNLPEVYLFGVDISRLIPGIIALSINSGAYIAEIVRAGISAVDKGQTEASRSLGLTDVMTMRFIIMPQAIKNILPALGNEFVVVIKESSILSVIGIAELMFNTGIVQSRTFIPLEPLFIAAAIYFVMTFTTSNIISYFERRMSTDDRS